MSSQAFRAFLELDAELFGAGFPRTPPWWLEQLERFYAHPTARRFVGRVGRGGVKSTTAAKFALAELLFNDWPVPLGERHWVAFVSIRTDEAGARLRQAKAMCDALRIDARLVGDELRFDDRPLGLKVFAASVAAVSGPRAVCKIGDELAKWWNDDKKANPAAEVVASLRAMSITHPNAREFLISSPLARSDYHYELMSLGDTADQVVAEAPTWIANPAVTEAATRAKEPDRRIWLREYAAVPQATTSAAFDVDAIDRAFRSRPSPAHRGHRVLVLDPSSGRKDAWTWAVAGWAFPESGPSYLDVELVDGIEGSFFGRVTSDDVVAKIAAVAHRETIGYVHADQRESFTLTSAFRRHGLGYNVHDWTSASKPEAVEKLRRWMAEDRVALPMHKKLRRELLEFEERITPTGAFTFGARGSGHDDYVALLLTATMAIGHLGRSHRSQWEMLEQVEERARRRNPGELGLNEPPLPRDAHRGTRWQGSSGRGYG